MERALLLRLALFLDFFGFLFLLGNTNLFLLVQLHNNVRVAGLAVHLLASLFREDLGHIGNHRHLLHFL